MESRFYGSIFYCHSIDSLWLPSASLWGSEDMCSSCCPVAQKPPLKSQGPKAEKTDDNNMKAITRLFVFTISFFYFCFGGLESFLPVDDV